MNGNIKISYSFMSDINLWGLYLDACKRTEHKEKKNGKRKQALAVEMLKDRYILLVSKNSASV